MDAIETARLVLRPYRADDAEELFALARDPAVGPAAGWAPHRDVAESARVIREVLSAPGTYAVCLSAAGAAEVGRRPGSLAGTVSLAGEGAGSLVRAPGELELGYWIGRPLWGHGFATEASRALIDRARAHLGCPRVWCGFWAGNARSLRVMEKLGVVFSRVERSVDVPRLGERRDLVAGSVDLSGRTASSRALELLEGVPEPERLLCVTEPLRLGRTGVRFLDAELGVLTRYGDAGCYYAVPFSREGALAIREAIRPGSVAWVSDAGLAPAISPRGRADAYEFWVHEGAVPPAPSGLSVRPLDEGDLDAVLARYSLLTPEEVRDHVGRGWVFGGYGPSGELVGFIGEHDEGSMGMLEVFPEHRRRGYGRALEAARIRALRACGRTPYCHVAPGNAASRALQAGLGLRRVGPLQCWVDVPGAPGRP